MRATVDDAGPSGIPTLLGGRTGVDGADWCGRHVRFAQHAQGTGLCGFASWPVVRLGRFGLGRAA